MLGILGGMGPLATAHFYGRLVALAPAERDQDHPAVVMWADPAVPDRTRALLEQGASPVPALIHGIRWLQQAGADWIAIPCNTAHAFVSELRQATGADIIDMIAVSVLRASQAQASVSRIGVLCTRGTRASQLYERAAEPSGIELIQVDPATQREQVDVAIELVKRHPGDPHALALAAEHITTATRRLREQGAEVVIAACTEVPLVMSGAAALLPMIDSTECLAARALELLHS